MTMTVLLIVHGLLAVALLGAITHQAVAVLVARARAGCRQLRHALSRGAVDHATSRRSCVLYS